MEIYSGKVDKSMFDKRKVENNAIPTLIDDVSEIQLQFFSTTRFYKGPSIKDVRTKSRKMTPPPGPCGHTINFEKSGVCAKKCGRPHL